MPESDWRPPSLGDLPSDWRKFKRVSIDTETKDPYLKSLGPSPRRGGYIVGYSLAFEDGPSFYVPLRHEGGDNVEDPGQAERYLRDQALTYDGIIVGANLSYDLDYLWTAGVLFPCIKFYRDVQIADPLINELHLSYSLQRICERYGIPGKVQGLMEEAARALKLNPKNDMWRLPARYVGPYATADAERPLDLIRKQERIIDEQDLWEVYDLESRVLPLLVKMRHRGVRIDMNRLEQVELWSLDQEAQALAEVKQASGIDIRVGDVWRAEALAAALKAIGYTVPKTDKGKESIKKDLLETIDHPVARAIARARKVNKIRTTFASSIREHQVNGRIHCLYNQLRATDEGEEEGTKGAGYGRLSSESPNMQQQPARDPELGPMWRSIYVPDEGKQWGTFDFSQQEPKWLIHWAIKCGPKYIGQEAYDAAVQAANMYKADIKADAYDVFSAFSGLKRKDAKEVYLGRVYGMGGKKMAGKLKLDTKFIIAKSSGRKIEVAGDEAQAIIDRFDRGVPYAKRMAELTEKQAKQRGYIRTHSGRRCRFPQDPDGNYDWTHKALNRLIQGSSADQVKIAMVACDNAGIPIQLQVHDELDLSIDNREQAEEMARIMVDAVQIEVPMRVDIELGPSWGEIE